MFKNAFTPPQLMTLRRNRCVKLATLFAAALISVPLVSIISSPAPAYAAGTAVVRGDLATNVPAQGIVLDSTTILQNSDFKFSSTMPYFAVDTVGVTTLDVSYRAIIYRGEDIKGRKELPGSCSMLWEDVGHDADGDRVDVELVISNVVLLHNETYQEYYNRIKANGASAETLNIVETKYKKNWWDNQATLMWVDPNSFGCQAPLGWGVKLDISFYAYKTDAKDPDTGEKIKVPASGMFWSHVTDLDLSGEKGSYSDEFAEQLKLVSKYAPTSYVRGDCCLNIEDNGTFFRPTRTTDGAGEALMSSVVFGLEPNGGTMQWSGYFSAGTGIMDMFEPHKITATASEGGTITDLGEKIVGFKNTPTYIATADPRYRILRILVDGREIPLSSADTQSYTFTPVIADHTIHVDFERVPVSIKWVDALTGEEVASYGLMRGETSPIPDIPTHKGRAFTHISGDDWHYVMKDSIVYINYASYLYTIPQYSSAKFNGFTFAYPVKDAGDEETSGE